MLCPSDTYLKMELNQVLKKFNVNEYEHGALIINTVWPWREALTLRESAWRSKKHMRPFWTSFPPTSLTCMDGPIKIQKTSNKKIIVASASEKDFKMVTHLFKCACFHWPSCKMLFPNTFLYQRVITTTAPRNGQCDQRCFEQGRIMMSVNHFVHRVWNFSHL